jgi:hypothetical protein
MVCQYINTAQAVTANSQSDQQNSNENLQKDIANLETIFDKMSIIDDENKEQTQGQRGIVARTARRWLKQLGFNWRDIKKGVYFDGHEREDVIEYRNNFVNRLEELWPYVVEFNDDGSMKDKTYPENYVVGSEDNNFRPIIIITHDESIFQSHDSRRQGWLYKDRQFIRPKGKGQGIMVSDFLLPNRRLSTISLKQEEKEQLGLPEFASILFEYGKEEGHWEGKDLVNHLTEIAIPIAEAVYPGYRFLFLFDNSANHGAFADDALRVQNMNLNPGGVQSFLRNGYINGDPTQIQVMWEYKYGTTTPPTRDSAIQVDNNSNPIRVQKGIQKILSERGLWPPEGMRLECPKKLCADCISAKCCKICLKGTKCGPCREKKVCSGPCNKRRKCDECERRRNCNICIAKRKCARCESYASVSRDCLKCKSMPPKCSTDGM